MDTKAPAGVLDYMKQPDRPTRARYIVLAFLCTLALLLYVDRVCIGQAAASIERDLSLSKTQMAWIFNAFTLAYCLFEVPTGHWGDRYGSRGVIARIAIWWSIFTALSGAAFGFYSLLAIRFLFGAGEAGAYPNTARVITRWFPLKARGKVRGAVVFVSFIGASIAPVVAAYLIRLVEWRWTFVIFGAVGVAWAIGFYIWFRDDPAEHPAVNSAELTLIGTTRHAPQLTGDAERIPWKRVLSSRNTWLLGTIMGVNSILFYILFQWYPSYLKEVRGQSEITTGWLTGFVMVGGAAGCVAGGLLADLALRRAWSQQLCGGSALFLAAVSVTLAPLMPSSGTVTFCCASAMFCIQLAIPTWWTVVAQISGRHGAAMWGLMNSLGGLGAMGGTFFVGWIMDRFKKTGVPATVAWQWIFAAIAVALAVGMFCWLAVRAKQSIVAANGTSSPHLT
jgi:MFS transporter, ACS family, glucarate transporter